MSKIPLAQRNFKGQYTLIDSTDYEWLSQWTWHIDGKGYVIRRWKKDGRWCGHVFMHRQILNVTDSKIEVDHINHNILDNRRKNLRLCTRSQNMGNQKLRVSSISGYKGVSWHKTAKRWQAMIRVNKRGIALGYYSTKEQAALAYNEAAKRYFGEFSLPNEV